MGYGVTKVIKEKGNKEMIDKLLKKGWSKQSRRLGYSGKEYYITLIKFVEGEKESYAG